MAGNEKKRKLNIKRLFTKKNSEYSAEVGDNTKKKKEKNIVISPTVVVFATYVLLLISKFIDVTLLNRDNEYMSVIILQMMIFLLPGALWCRFCGEKYMSGLRLRLPKLRSVPFMVFATLLMISGGLLLSMLLGGLNTLSDNFTLYDTFTSKSDGTVSNSLYLVLAYALLPAICEEFVYRGILCYEYERGGVLRAVALSSVFFALLHFNLANFPVYLFCGVILALVLYATRSLVGVVIVHFLYNIFGLFGQRYMGNLYRMTSDSKLLFIIVGMVFLMSAALFCGEASRLYRGYLRSGESSNYRKPVFKSPEQWKNAFVEVIKEPATIACLAVYIIAVVISWL